jgi:DNA (cytosine-5)-methyltransferase 1
MNSFFEIEITKPIRLIELFSGLGAQAKALERLNANFEHWKTSDWDVSAVASYHKIHDS